MAQVEGEIVIDRPVESVFDFVANQCNEPLYNPEMLSVEQVTGGPVGLGTRFEVIMRQGRRESPLTIEFTEFERPARLGSRSRMSGMCTEGGLTFEPVGGSTRMRWEWDVRLNGALRLLSPLVGWIGDRKERRIWTSLKHHLEGHESRPGAEPADGRREDQGE